MEHLIQALYGTFPKQKFTSDKSTPQSNLFKETFSWWSSYNGVTLVYANAKAETVMSSS